MVVTSWICSDGIEEAAMKNYKLSFDKSLGLVMELRVESDLPDRRVIVLEDYDEVRDF